jgi:DNA invertase Pin-like site-specific DNA recombinase
MFDHGHLADLYLRVSIDREGKTAIERQEADCRSWAEHNRVDVRSVHIDRGRSGYKAVSRKGFDSAISALTTRTVGTLIVSKVDRLSRRGMGQVGEVLEDVDRAGGRIVFVHDGIDTSQKQARLALALLCEIARSESANMGHRISSAKAHLRTLGRWIGGKPPYGLIVGADGRLDHYPQTAPIAREIADRALAAEPLIRIARDLNERGVPSPRGGKWGVGTLSQLLKSPALAGLLPETVKQNGKYTQVVPWRSPDSGETVEVGRGIITPAEQVQIVRLLGDRAAGDKTGGTRNGRAGISFLMTGRLRCGACRGRMSAAGRSYVCQAVRTGHPCPAHTTAYIAAVDRAVAAAWIGRLAAAVPGEPFVEAVVERWVALHDPKVIRERTTIRGAIDDAEVALVDLEEARYLRNEFQNPEAIKRWDHMREHLSTRIESLRRNLIDHPLPEVDIIRLLDPIQAREAWEVANPCERRALLSLAIKSVTVLSANGRRGYRFDPASRLRFAWVDEPEPIDVAT